MSDDGRAWADCDIDVGLRPHPALSRRSHAKAGTCRTQHSCHLLSSILYLQFPCFPHLLTRGRTKAVQVKKGKSPSQPQPCNRKGERARLGRKRWRPRRATSNFYRRIPARTRRLETSFECVPAGFLTRTYLINTEGVRCQRFGAAARGEEGRIFQAFWFRKAWTIQAQRRIPTNPQYPK